MGEDEIDGSIAWPVAPHSFGDNNCGDTKLGSVGTSSRDDPL